MKRSTLLVWLLLAGLALFGCQQQDVVIPTVAQLPSITPTFTPTLTLTPTPTLTPTFTPTLTATPTASATFTPTMTPTMSETPTATFTPIYTSTPAPTLTPTFTETPVGPVITAFTVDNPTVQAGGVTVVRWQGLAESGLLEQVNQQGVVTQSWAVAATGEQAMQVPASQGSLITYRLTLYRQGLSTTQQLQVSVTCGYDWFFGNQYAPGVCPANLGAIGDGLFQVFENGFMIYTPTPSEGYPGNSVYVFFNNGNQWHRYDAVGSASATGSPPSGRWLPGNALLANIWESGIHNGQPVKSLIGWATTQNPDTSARTYQVQSGGGVLYFDAPNGALFRLAGTTSGTWSQIR